MFIAQINDILIFSQTIDPLQFLLERSAKSKRPFEKNLTWQKRKTSNAKRSPVRIPLDRVLEN